VRFIMGTPLIQDSFHGKRWDYVYQMRESGKIIEQRRVILDFENDLLKTVRGDVVPSGSDLAKPDEVSENTGARVINPSAKAEDKSLLSKLKFWEKDKAELADEAATLKAKAAADEVAKAAALPKENAVLVPKAVTKPEEAPVVIVPTIEAPTAVTPPDVASKVIESAPIIEPATIEVAPVEVVTASPAPTSLPAVEVSESAPESIVSTAYSSSSGMQFDRTLRLAPEDMESAVKPEVAAPRAGNKTIPKPKELPVDNPPSFFDRMLEKIGF
jgi:outer membrane protein assembly factor BamE